MIDIIDSLNSITKRKAARITRAAGITKPWRANGARRNISLECVVYLLSKNPRLTKCDIAKAFNISADAARRYCRNVAAADTDRAEAMRARINAGLEKKGAPCAEWLVDIVMPGA